MQSLEAAASMRAVFVGEAIDDVYRYGHLLARPLKEPIIAIEATEERIYHGGIHAAADIARRFCNTTLSCDGSVKEYYDRKLLKIRYIERDHNRKLFEVYQKPPEPYITPMLPVGNFDLVCVIDYGHGMMTPERIAWVRDLSPFLAVNVQVNAGNYGYNLATRYENADYLCLDEIEARLATQNRDGPIRDSLPDLTMLAPRVVITLGRLGSIGWSREDGEHESPALTQTTLDTMGAGDAFFAVSALAAAGGAGIVEMMRLGNAAGAAKSQVIGHSRAIGRKDIDKIMAARPEYEWHGC